MAAENVYPEEAFESKFQNCINDAMVKTGTGLLIGALGSLFFCKRATWPVCAGTFFGFGASTKFCEKDLEQIMNSACKKKEEEPPKKEEPDKGKKK